MSSLKQIEANRRNGAKSRGPITSAGKAASAANSAKSTGPSTPEGKARSARNAIRHGILAHSTVLDTESVERFCEILASFHDELDPVTPIETRFVETMALAEWRRLRLICLEKEQISAEARRQEQAGFNQTEAATDSASPLHFTALALRALCRESDAQELLNRHELRFDRQFQRALNGFRAYRAMRLESEK
ncbi:MAG TPA: hypothetical protein VG297_21715 [Bryobacteraceae bacterium]|jgi:hypothetical protein|nr:hypothetical protein [Bryobacteraceae bacterium]